MRPRVDPRALRVGIVHLGLGAFHRAHQAVFTEDADDGWAICGVSQRSARAVEQLAPQDGLYTVLTRGSDGVEARVVSTVRELIYAKADPTRVIARIADPAVQITTLTVTEKGYRHDPATGRLRGGDAGIRADLAGGPPRTVIGQLVRGLESRMRHDAGPHTVLCCDNLASNGRTLAGLVRDFLELSGQKRLQAWIDSNVSFPNCMVDRIVPAATDADREAAYALTGLHDQVVVSTEPFRQWMIEDDFRGGRPAWEKAGALLVDDVAPYETMKLRLLNGSHSTLAYLGCLAGYRTIAEATGAFGDVVWRLMHDDVAPTLRLPGGFDLDAYQLQLLERFANPALRHLTAQVAMDGSHKLPQRLLATIRARRAAGAEPRWATYAVAAWMRWVQVAPELADPMAPRLHAAVAAACTPKAVVDALLDLGEIFGDLRDDAVVRDLLIDALDRLA